jgi:transposase
VEQGQISSVSADEKVVSVSRVKELERMAQELERVLGRKSLEVDVLREAVRLGRQKNSYRNGPCWEWKISNETKLRRDESVPFKLD